MTHERTITEAEAERRIDAMILARIRTDPRYVHAENAQDQAAAEAAISEEAEADLYSRYEVAG